VRRLVVGEGDGGGFVYIRVGLVKVYRGDWM
jgi:hypothetical protein